MANSVDPDQTAPAPCPRFLLPYKNSPVMLGNYLQQTTQADDVFRCILFLGALRVIGWYFSFLFQFYYNILYANSGYHDQPPHFAASGLCLHCLPMSYKKNARLKWDKNATGMGAYQM